MDGDIDEPLARLAGAVVFLIAAAIALAAAWLSASMESYTAWSDPQPTALSVFGGASVVAAGIATLRSSTWPARCAGFLLIAPAVFLLDAADTDGDWAMNIGAAAFVLLGGALAGGLLRRPGRRR